MTDDPFTTWSSLSAASVALAAFGNDSSNVSGPCANASACERGGVLSGGGGPVWSMKYPLYATVVIAALAGVCSVVTVVGNIMVLAAFALERTIRQPSNYLIASLAVTDVLIGLFSMPLYTLYLLSDQYWPLGEWRCDLWLSLDYTVCLVSQYTVFLITLDRFCSVKIPARYRTWRTACKMKVMIAGTWVVPSLVFFISVIGWQHFVGVRTVAPHECYVQFTEDPLFNTVLVISYYWVTLVIMIVLYVGIYRVALGLHAKSEAKRKRVGRITSAGSSATASRKEGSESSGAAEKTTAAADQCNGAAEPPASGRRDGAAEAPAVTAQDARGGALRGSFVGGSSKSAEKEMSSSSVEGASPSSLEPPFAELQRRALLVFPLEGMNLLAASTSDDDDSLKKLPSTRPSALKLPKGSAADVGAMTVTSQAGSGPPQTALLAFSDLESPLWKPRASLPNCSVDWTCFAKASKVERKIVANGHAPCRRVRSEPVKAIEAIAAAEATATAAAQPNFSRAINKLCSNLVQLTRGSTKDSASKRSQSENRAQKALKTITLILGAFVFFWTPYHIAVLVVGFCPQKQECVDRTFFALSYWLCYCNSPLNPFCYALSNEQFKKSFLKMLRFQYCSSRNRK